MEGDGTSQAERRDHPGRVEEDPVGDLTLAFDDSDVGGYFQKGNVPDQTTIQNVTLGDKEQKKILLKKKNWPTKSPRRITWNKQRWLWKRFNKKFPIESNLVV
jgi:hypothetical protein